MIPSPRLIALYLLMLFLHVGHVLEEVYGRFWIMKTVWGTGLYLLANGFLFALPLALLYFVLMGRRWAYILSRVYAVLMIADGLGHNIALLAIGRYFGGLAGAVSGWGLIAGGLLLYRQLWRDQRLGEASR